MKYENVILADFINRDNRFIAHCRLENGEVVVVHVKNTGRGKEVLLFDAKVALVYCPSPTRKTDYDLIAVKKGDNWINIDSQLPNKLAFTGIKAGKIVLSGLSGNITLLKPEVKYGHSKFDFYFETDQKERGFVEVKGLTLENQQIGAFPDAPTTRGLKHISELTLSQNQGYHSYVLFIIQFEKVQLATLHTKMQPQLHEALAAAMDSGVQVLAYNCQVNPDEVEVLQKIPFDLAYPFEDPN